MNFKGSFFLSLEKKGSLCSRRKTKSKGKPKLPAEREQSGSQVALPAHIPMSLRLARALANGTNGERAKTGWKQNHTLGCDGFTKPRVDHKNSLQVGSMGEVTWIWLFSGPKQVFGPLEPVPRFPSYRSRRGAISNQEWIVVFRRGSWNVWLLFPLVSFGVLWYPLVS